MSDIFDGVYFSSAEPAMEGFLEKGTFEKSLLLNLLFQPRIMIPDSFFFSSSGLNSHVLNNKKQTLLEAALAYGLVVPVFRNKTTTSFIESYQIIAKASLRGVFNNSETVAKRLQFAIDNNKNFSPKFWPDHNVGEKYEQVIKKCLMSDAPPMTEPQNIVRLEAIWEITKKWRFDTLSRAIDNTHKIAGTGLRKSEIIGSLAYELGVNDISTIQQPIDLAKLPLGSRKKRESLVFFCIWFSSLYVYNQAFEFGATPNFPEYESLSGATLSNLLPGNNPYLENEKIEKTFDNKYSTIQETVKLPPFETLIAMKPDDLIAIRMECGPDYFVTLSDWQANPNYQNEKGSVSSVV